MPRKIKIALMSLGLIAGVGWYGTASAQPAEACLTPKWRSLRLYQALLHADRPDFSALGFAPAHIIDRNIWANETTREEVSPQKLEATVTRAARQGGLIVLDIEHFPLTGTDAKVHDSVEQLVRAATIARRAADGNLVGYYGLVPLSEYWRPINGLAHGGFDEWRKDNRRLLPIAGAVDANLPSLYTHYDDREGWVKQARTLVCEARRMSERPVIAFIWPEFHPGSKAESGDIPGDYWRLQLETLAEIADGVVIWGGYDLAENRQQQWRQNAPWWQETLRFLDRHRRDRSSRPVG